MGWLYHLLTGIPYHTAPDRASLPPPEDVGAASRSPTVRNGVHAVKEIADQVARTGQPPNPVQVRHAEWLLRSGNPLADRLADRWEQG